jgi:hypoxanthine phosphoribosyltransferase
MQKIKIKDKHFEHFIAEEQIQKAITQLAEKINLDYKDEPYTIIGVLNGSFMFTSDLMKKLDGEVSITFVKLSSYSGIVSTGSINSLIGLNESIEGKNIIIAEDIIDTGLTLKHLLFLMNDKQPKSVKVATLLFKPSAFREDYQIDYVGVEIPNDFIVGYGLDYDGLGRNLPAIYKISTESN